MHLEEISIRKFFRGRVLYARDISQHHRLSAVRKFFRGRVSSARDVRKEGLKGVESKLIIAPPQG